MSSSDTRLSIFIYEPSRRRAASSFCARRQDTASILKFIFIFIRASFLLFWSRGACSTYAVSKLTDSTLKKLLHPHQGRRNSPRYHPNSFERFEGCKLKVTSIQLLNLPTFKHSLIAITGFPVDDYFASPSKSPSTSGLDPPLRVTGEFSLCGIPVRCR